MPAPDIGPFDLERALTAISRIQRRFMSDLTTTISAPDPRFMSAFRRWEENLTHLKLAVHRAEQLLLHYLLVPESYRPWRDLPGPRISLADSVQGWQQRITPYFHLLHIDTVYRRLEHPLDLQAQAATADILTDLVSVAAIASCTEAALERFADDPDPTTIEDLAFYHVISPWKQRGMPALFDCLLWLQAYLGEHDAI
ncbi:MAG: hypothetical protein ACOCXA_04320 [Planctomycetota bacterium]